MTTSSWTTTPSRVTDMDLDLLLLIRHFEWAVLDLFGRGLVHGTTHTCLGQEYIPVALSALLDAGDHVFSNHRGHGHYLARFADPRGLLAEIMGREGAVCGGVGGSQHILRDRYLSTGVQGQTLPVAAGVAVHLARTEPGRLACVYIGDGTWGEGAVYEALNLAALWRLPLLVVVEHNRIAQSTPTRQAMAGTIGDRARAFGIPHLHVSTVDINEIRTEISGPVSEIRRLGGPLVIEFATTRLGPHSKGDDTRSEAELAGLPDWYELYRSAHRDQFEQADTRQREAVAAVVAQVCARSEIGSTP